LIADKAFHILGWQPVWDFERTVQETVVWYCQASQFMLEDREEKIQALTLQQIEQYQSDAVKEKMPMFYTANNIYKKL
jgi:CDP-glucose 4,6-dehydratase